MGTWYDGASGPYHRVLGGKFTNFDALYSGRCIEGLQECTADTALGYIPLISVHGSPRMKVALLLAHDLARLLVLTLPLALKNLRWFVSRSWLKGIAVLPSVALPPEASRYAPALHGA